MRVSRLWGFLGSHRLAVLLIGLLAGVVMLGGTLPQTGRLSPDQRQGLQTDWNHVASWLDALQLSDVFGSWWFAVLYGLLVINLVVGTLQTFIWRYRWLQGKTSPSFEAEYRGCFSAAALQPLCAAFGFAPVKGVQLRQATGLWGLPLFHLGIAVVVVGGVWSAAHGFGAHLELSEGEAYDGREEKLAQARGKGGSVELDALLQLQKTHVAISEQGHLRELRALFRVRDEGGSTKSRLLEINHPLKIGIYELALNKMGGYSAVFERIKKDGSRKRMFVHFHVPLHQWNWDGKWVVQRNVLVELDDAPLYYEMRLQGRDNPRLYLTVKRGVETLFEGELRKGSTADLGAYRLIFQGVTPWLGFYLSTDYPKYMVFLGFVVMLSGFLLHLTFHPRRIEVVQEMVGWRIRVWSLPADWYFEEFWQRNLSREGSERDAPGDSGSSREPGEVAREGKR